MEFKNARQALEFLYKLSQLDEVTIQTYEKQDCIGLIEERKATVKDMQEYDTAAKQVALYSVLGDKYSVKKPSKYLNRVIKYYNENIYEK